MQVTGAESRDKDEKIKGFGDTMLSSKDCYSILLKRVLQQKQAAMKCILNRIRILLARVQYSDGFQLTP